MKLIYLKLKKYFSNKAAIGIMTNIKVETGRTFDEKINQKNGPGYGLFQFDYMKKHYFEFLKT
jgi:hypothetical protein